MKPTHTHSRLPRTLLALLLFGSLAVGLSPGNGLAASGVRDVGTGTQDPGNTTIPIQPSVGADLTEFDTPSAKFTQLANGLIGAQVYATRVGINDPSGWRFRNPNLGSVAADGTVSPVDEPFSLHIATTAGAPALATLSNENSYTLGVGAVAVDGVPLPASTGVVSTTSVLFSSGSATPPVDDLTVGSTVSGLSLQIGLQQPGSSGRISVPLTLDPRLTLAPLDDGSVTAQQVITRYGDDGITPFQDNSPNFNIATPLVQDAAGVAAPTGQVGGASLQLSTGSDGKPVVTAAVDPAWLNSPSRVYPVRVTVHIDTALSIVNEGTSSGSVTCGATTTLAVTSLSAGVVGGCTSTAHVYFDTSQIVPNTNIQHAVLQIVSPSGGAPGVLLAQDEHTGTAATTIATPSAGSGLGTSTGPVQIAPGGAIQSWDLTSLAQAWVQTNSSNQGVRISSTGPVVQLASIEMARSAPQLMPVLNLVLDPNPIPRPSENTQGNLNAPAVAGIGDGIKTFIYGAAGTFNDCGTPINSGGQYTHVCNDLTTALSTVQTRTCNGSNCSGFGGTLVRLPVYLICGGTAPSWTGIDGLMTAAVGRGLVPIVNFVAPQSDPNQNCPQNPSYYVTPAQWYTVMSQFAQQAPTVPNIYFEIGNEEDLYPYYLDYTQTYFAATAGLYWNLPSSRFPWYRLLVGGLLGPRGGGSQCGNGGQSSHANDWVGYAFTHTYQGQSRPLRQVVLGIAIHPYTFTASDTSFHNSIPYNFPNPNSKTGQLIDPNNFQASPCTGLDTTVQYIEAAPNLAGLPIIMSEVNATTARMPAGDQTDIDNVNNLAGAYMADLFSYMYDRCGFASFACRTGPIVPPSSPVRVIWNRGNDQTEGSQYDALGIYDPHGVEKFMPPLSRCNGQKDKMQGATQSHAFYYLRNGNCD